MFQVGGHTDLAYLGITMMKEFNELEALFEISSCCNGTELCWFAVPPRVPRA